MVEDLSFSLCERLLEKDLGGVRVGGKEVGFGLFFVGWVNRDGICGGWFGEM